MWKLTRKRGGATMEEEAAEEEIETWWFLRDCRPQGQLAEREEGELQGESQDEGSYCFFFGRFFLQRRRGGATMEEEAVSFSAVFFAKEARGSYRREEGRAGRCKSYEWKPHRRKAAKPGRHEGPRRPGPS
jgi:hypothetical protein